MLRNNLGQAAVFIRAILTVILSIAVVSQRNALTTVGAPEGQRGLVPRQSTEVLQVPRSHLN